MLLLLAVCPFDTTCPDFHFLMTMFMLAKYFFNVWPVAPISRPEARKDFIILPFAFSTRCTFRANKTVGLPELGSRSMLSPFSRSARFLHMGDRLYPAYTKFATTTDFYNKLSNVVASLFSSWMLLLSGVPPGMVRAKGICDVGLSRPLSGQARTLGHLLSGSVRHKFKCLSPSPYPEFC